MDLGLVAYRPYTTTGADWWDAGYARGDWDYLSVDVVERSRLSVIAECVRAHLPDGGSVLDVGCGDGALRQYLDDRTLGQYVGVDASRVAIERARAHNLHASVFEVGGLDSLLVPADVVVLAEVLYTLASARDAIDRAAELVAPGGHLVTSTWRHRGDRTLARMVRRRFMALVTLDLDVRAPRRASFRIQVHSPR
jgi:2-polyprenyl-3-methyl-5-hydroxy-6-metoxy-1,4-benzoquinol methylase